MNKKGSFCSYGSFLWIAAYRKWDSFVPTVSHSCSTVALWNVKQCNGSIYVTSSNNSPLNTELSHPDLISTRDKRNRIGGLVAWDKNDPTVLKG